MNPEHAQEGVCVVARSDEHANVPPSAPRPRQALRAACACGAVLLAIANGGAA